MRCSYSLALCAFVALSIFHGSVSSRGIGIGRRQGSGITTATASQSANSPSATAASDISDISGTTTVKATATGSALNNKTQTALPGITTTLAGSYDGSNVTVGPGDAVYSGGLPITPRVSPGIGIAGVILMLAGAPLCLIGIKLQVLQIFLSTFFLSGLGVTVLIIYVMNPPVSDAIQGAYVTAVVITGILTGCLAVVFPEVTEALGCLLGGFCVSMWFIVLKPGGLVTSIYGKLIIIAAFCFVTFSLAFHKTTRPYSLIFSISFAGATATVLGIDCFSRAGLKEFWIYIWALNDNIFPLGTNNYPHTRGIRVEIAVIILITAFGVMSQVKLWKILKERRKAKEVEKNRQVADLEALDEDVGRRVEEGHKVERAQWEVAYGGKAMEVTVDERPGTGDVSRADSGIGDEDYRKKSGETVEEFVETEEMRREREEHTQIESRKQSPDVTSQQPSTQDDEIEEIGPGNAVRDGDGSLSLGLASRRQSPQSSKPQSERISAQSLLQSEAAMEKPDVPPTPEVIPLPVPIPVENGDDDDEVSSLATWAESSRSLQDMEIITTPILVKPENDDDDRASSVAATYDEEDYLPEAAHDLPAINEETERSTSSLSSIETDDNITPIRTSFGIPTNRETQETAGEHTLRRKRVSSLPIVDLQVSESGKDSTSSSFGGDLFTSNRSKANTTHQTTPAVTSPPPVTDAALSKSARLPENLAPSSFPKTNISASSAVGADFNSQMRVNCSRVVKNYRTNEWAKHLADAEIPELGQLEEYVPVIDTPTEISAPVHVKELQETSDMPSQPPQRSASKMSLHEPVNPTLVSSNLQTSTSHLVKRKSSVPIIPPEDRQGSTSPVEHCVSPASNGKRTPSPLPQNTLIGRRENMVRSRQNINILPEYGPSSSTGTLDIRSQSPNTGLIFHPSLNPPGPSRSPTPNMHPPQISSNDNHQHRPGMLDDNMSLANRRSELVHRSVSQNTLNGTLQQGRRNFTPQPQLPDKREAKLRAWRESVETDLQMNNHLAHTTQDRRGEISSERQQLILAERQKGMRENLKDEMVDERMRQKDMLELHKEALRKMQAGANKHIQK